MLELHQARYWLKQAVETQGKDFRYCLPGQGCYYEPTTTVPDYDAEAKNGVTTYKELPEGDPRRETGCLIGTALTLSGETLHLGFRGRVRELQENFPDMFNDEVRRYFTLAQHLQDRGVSWHEAYERAEELAMSEATY